ncbi:unnamed protein product [Adineta steineri]|uniref:Uncharacterized protein n=1 Tax=Adineta steineri TaxID=433720 RepID=A0A813PTD2_9BILA|nr:unnamed protein product [Adineta steineri]
MDLIITALGEFVWAASCAVINFCVSSGFSAVVVFVSFLCAILASAFYKYTLSREEMSLDDTTCSYVTHDNNQSDESIMIPSTTDSSNTSSLPIIITSTDESNNINNDESLSEIEVYIEENNDENNENEDNNEQSTDDILIDTIEGSEEEIQKQQIANIYRLLNDQHLINNWTTTDFLDQLKMYGLEAYEEDELETS